MSQSASAALPEPAMADLWPALGPALQDWVRKQGALVALKDVAELRYVQADQGLATLVGRSLADLLGRTDAELFDGLVAQSLRSADQTALAHGAALDSEHRFELRGERREFNVQRLAITVAGRALLCCIWHDLAPQRQREAQLKAALDQLEREQRNLESLRKELADQGLRDAATGLYSRTHFDDQLRREVDLSTREHREFAMVLIELDPFDQRVADAGAAGEQRVFEAMGRLLRGNTRAMDTSCRLEGRRFAVLLSGVGLATAHSRMEGLRRQCATQIVVLEGRELGFSVSMGVASFPHTAHTQEELHAACEKALADAQRRGGNTVALASIRFEPA
jgi:diguanylate cyclase (GGDEF)-like protein